MLKHPDGNFFCLQMTLLVRHLRKKNASKGFPIQWTYRNEFIEQHFEISL